MNKVRVEVFYQDNALQSIRIDHYEMEGLVVVDTDRKSTRLNSSHLDGSRMPSSA